MSCIIKQSGSVVGQVEGFELPKHSHREMIVTAFSDGTAGYFLNILPRSRFNNTGLVIGEIIGELEDVCGFEGRNPQTRNPSF
jgi:hypothetical protein